MPFKVVKSFEDGETFISAIPSAWEQEGVLRWPQAIGNIDKLRCNGKSVPNENWREIQCKVLCDSIDSFGEAVKMEKMLENAMTENEDEIAHHQVKKKKKNRNQDSTSIKVRPVKFDFNHLLAEMSPQNAEGRTLMGDQFLVPVPHTQMIQTPAASQEEISGLPSMIPASRMREESSLTIHELQDLFNQQFCNSVISQEVNEPSTNNLTSDTQQMVATNECVDEDDEDEETASEEKKQSGKTECDHREDFLTLFSKVDELKTNIKEESEISARYRSEMTVKINKILDILHTPGPSRTAHSAINLGSPNKSLEFLNSIQISTIPDIDNLEAKLRDDTAYKKEFLERMKIFAGTTGSVEGKTVAYKLIDKLFTRDLLLKFSWTGATKADYKYSVQDNEIFFKTKILKHSAARVARELIRNK